MAKKSMMTNLGAEEVKILDRARQHFEQTTGVRMKRHMALKVILRLFRDELDIIEHEIKAEEKE